MKKAKNVKLKGYNLYIKGRGIPKGCKFCLKGQKTVLFLNGICQKPDHCSWYCPISTERRDQNVSYANEIEITSKEELLDEINNIDAKGLSITGGEPLSELNLEKTINYIKFVKGEMGKKFHIHLYTNGINFNESIANKLAKNGLDEIRFHPPKEKWENIEFALNKGIKVGVEVPVIPKKEKMKDLEDLTLYLDRIGVDFINLNEFEFCFPNSEALKNKGFQLKKGSIASVVNSYEFGVEFLNNLSKKVSIKMHFCSIRSKDYQQLKKRYLRRAKNIRLPFEVITEEGLLIYAQIEGHYEDLEKFYTLLVTELKTDKKLLLLSENDLKMPFYLSLEDQTIFLINDFHLKGFIVEMTPFREAKYQQITEKTPIKLFKEQFD
jgi:pyruvate formate-lyase activating enzyme-like uncharacterized protein